MSKHLSDELLADIAESGHEHDHLRTCARCREQVEQARALLGTLHGTAAPEPSPLFWEHFSARVRRAIRDEGAVHGDAGAWRPRIGALSLKGVVACAAIVLVVAVAAWQGASVLREERSGRRHAGISDNERTPTIAPVEEMAGPSADASWGLVTEVAANLDLDEAAQAGFSLEPGSAEKAASQLDPDEQRELIRLLQLAVAETDVP